MKTFFWNNHVERVFLQLCLEQGAIRRGVMGPGGGYGGGFGQNKMTPRGPSEDYYLTQNGSVWSRYITADWPRTSSCQNRFCKNTQNGFSSICFSPARLIALANRILILPSSPAGLGYLILPLFCYLSFSQYFCQFNMTHSFVNCVCSASGIFLSEQMVGEPMQSAEVYDFSGHTGRGARYAGNGPDGFV